MSTVAHLIAEADRLYAARDWAGALDHYRRAHALDAAAPGSFAMGHCAIEVAAPDAMDVAIAPPDVIGDERDVRCVVELRMRILELCFAQDFPRAKRLLDYLGETDRSVQAAYQAMNQGPSACLAFLEPPSAPIAPPFLDAMLVADAELASFKARHAGKRVLVACQRYFDAPTLRHDLIDNLTRSARDFGLVVQEINSHVLAPGMTVEEFPSHLMREIIGFRPDVIIYADLFNLGVSAATQEVGEAIGMVLQQVRELMGVRVVRTLLDAWDVAARGDEHLFRGLGTSVDLLHHIHPAILGRGTPDQQAATLCYVYPNSVEPPTVPIGSVPRVSFAGTLHHASMGRMVWWVEAARAGLPIDFVVTFPWETPHLKSPRLDDVAFANLLGGHQLSINLTQRFGGARIMTGRTMEVLLAGGVLLEENSIDTAYFLQPGVHYMPFETLDDVRTLIARLLPDAARRHALAEAGHDWARRYFSGERFWAEILAKLEGL